MRVAKSFNHLVRAHQNGMRNGYAERLGGPQIDRELDAAGLLDREIGRLGALKDAIDVSRRPSKAVAEIRAVSHEAPNLRILPSSINRGHAVLDCKTCD